MPRTNVAHLPIVDTHLHLWDLKQFRPPWLALKGEEKINVRSTLAEYRTATANLNVVKAVYMEVDVAPKQQVEEADWIASLCQSRKTLVAKAVVSGRPAAPGFEAYAKRWKGNPAVFGFRQVLQVPDAKPGLCLTDPFVRSVRTLGKWGKSFDICIRPAELADAAKLAKLCPDTQFILDHCGNASARNPAQRQWERDIALVAKQANVVCKISGIVKTVPAGRDIAAELGQILRHTADCFGPDRLLFGGDWPVCNKTADFKQWVQAVDTVFADASEGERRKLFHDNAVRFYGLK